jgi:penicillin-binding protein 2
MTTFGPDRLRDRAALSQLVLAGTFVLLAAAFFRAQVIGFADYRLQSEKNRLRQVPLVAPRGTILDRNGLILAENTPGYTVKLFAPSADTMRAVLARLGSVVPLDSGTVELIMRRFREAQYQPAMVFAGADSTVVARLEEHRYLLPGLVVQAEPRRVYRAAGAVAHLVGYVNEVSEDELDAGRYAGARMGSAVGRDGLEQEYDSTLRGVDGVRYTEVDARGRMVREEVSSPSLSPIAGNLIRTTVDLPLQLFIDSLWKAREPNTKGAMVAMEPNGAILALYSSPTFDPNDFIGGITAARWNALNSDEAKPLINRAIRGRYPPGSPFKLATAVMALRRGLVNFDSHMPEPCRGGLQFGNRYFRCWKQGGHGSLDLVGAIAGSCDVYFYQLGLRLGLPNLLEDGNSLGFNDVTGIDLQKEVSSFLPRNTVYYNERYGPRGWSNAATLNLAIGQGENTQSLMNMVRFYAALAGDGTIGPPYIVKPRPGKRLSLGISAEQLLGLRQAMQKVVQSGTAAGSGGRDLDVAGKTGTAQNSTGKNHGWFIGYAPADHPKLVVGAIMESLGGHGGAYVAPYVVQVIRRFLVAQDPALRGARIRVPIVEDSVAGADSIPDTTVTLPVRRRP